MAKKSNRKLIIGILVAVLIVLIALATLRSRNKPKGIEVTLEEVSKRTIVEKVTASGKVFPEKEVKISSDVSGEIVELYVIEGDSVKAGQILAKIDPEAYVSAVERGKAALNNAKAQSSVSKSQIQNAIAQKEQILAQIAQAQKIFDRNAKLFKDGVISSADYEQSEANLSALQANLRAAEASIESAENSSDGSQFSIESAEAALRELQTSLNKTTIKAPVSGVVSSLSVEQGERVVGTIQMAGTEMMRIANLNAMEAQVEVSENDILKVSLGDEVEIEVDAYFDKKFKGTVTEIANSAANIATQSISLNTDQVTNFIVKARIDESSYKELMKNGMKFPFRPGMSASVDIFTEKKVDQLTVPIQAVTTREEKSDDKKKEDDNDKDIKEVVFVYEADTARMVEVKTDIQDDEFIIVKEGLKDGEKIVSGPYSVLSKKIKEGDILREKEEKDKEK